MMQPQSQPSTASGWLRALLAAAALALILALGHWLRTDWTSQLRDAGVSGDALHYFKIAAHWQADGIYSLDGKEPTWTRLPGYPALLIALTSPTPAHTLAPDPLEERQRVYAWIMSTQRLNSAFDLGCAAALALLAWTLGAGPWALAGALAWAVQPWTTVVAAHPLSDPVAALLVTLALAALAAAVGNGRARWFVLAGALTALAQLVRSDAALLVPALIAAAALADGSWRRRGVLLAAALAAWAAVLTPWAARNLVRFGAPHVLGGTTNIDLNGRTFDRSAVIEWERTFAADEHSTVDVAWRFPNRRLTVDDLPASAIDWPAQERAVRAVLDDYNYPVPHLDDALNERFRRLARAHRAHHPFAYWVGLPLRRIARVLFPPRDGFGLGTLPTLVAHRVLWCVLDGGLMLLGLAAMIARRGRGLVLVALALSLRLATVAWLPSIEPRYLYSALPSLYAAATVTLAAECRRVICRGR